MQSWCRTWQLIGNNHTSEKLKLLRRRKEVYESFSSRRKSRKSCVLTSLCNLVKNVKKFPGIIVHLRLTFPKQLVLLKEWNAKSRKEFLRCCCNLAWTKSGELIPWNFTVICETFKTSLSDGKTPYERRFGEPFNRPIIPFGSMIEYHPISARDQSRLH